MNNKAQTSFQLGTILLMFIGALVGLILFQAVATQTGASLNTAFSNNTTFTGPADGVTIDLVGQELLSTPVVSNDSEIVLASTNYTIDEGVSETTGVKSIQYEAIGSHIDGVQINVTYTYGPDGYIDDSGARAVVPLILIFFALAIIIVVLEPTMRSGIVDMMGR